MTRRTLRLAVALVLVAAVAACAASTLRQLDRMKSLSAAGDHAAVAATAVDCTGGPGCAQAHMIRADSCLTLAQGASVDDRAAPAACARAGYGRALAALAEEDDPAVDPLRLRANRLEALRLERDASGTAEGLALNERLASRIDDYVDAGGARARAAFYEANVLAFEVAFGEVTAPCAVLDEAVALAGVARDPALGDAPRQLRGDLADMRTARGCRP